MLSRHIISRTASSVECRVRFEALGHASALSSRVRTLHGPATARLTASGHTVAATFQGRSASLVSPPTRQGLRLTRATSGLAHRNTAPDFPDLPPAPRYPCPFLTDEEIATYLGPLYARAWSVQRSGPGPKNKPAPELVKRFAFTTPEALDAFLRDVADITKSEDHHAVEEKTLDPPAVVIKVHTHSGLRPARDAEEPRRARLQPGITLRDVRFAYLVEQRSSVYETRGETEPVGVAGTPSVEEQPRSAEALEARRGSSGAAEAR